VGALLCAIREIIQIEKPRCSAKIDQIRSMNSSLDSRNFSSSGFHSEIQAVSRHRDLEYRADGRWPLQAAAGGGRGAVAICVGIDFSAISRVTRLPYHAARSIV